MTMTRLPGVPTLRTNLADYPVTKAMKDGRVKASDLVKLDFCGPTPAHNGFKAMVRENAFDAGELAIVTFLQAKAYGKPYVLLPAPISGRFQHHCAGFNIDFGHLDPKDIEGKQVGVRTYTQTTAPVDPRHPAPRIRRRPRQGHLDDARRRPPGRVQRPGQLRAPAQGFVDPADDAGRRTGRRPARRGHAEGSARAHLVPDAHNAAKDWFAREGVVPINHMFVVHEELSKQRPDIVREIYRMIVESRELTEGGVPRSSRRWAGSQPQGPATGDRLGARPEDHPARACRYDELFDDQANPAAAAAQDDASTVGEIVVTGSRVIKNGDASPSPVTVVATADVLRMQPGNLADALQVLPVFAGSRGSGVNPTSTGSVGAGNASANQLNLRNIGPNRTLVLLDGLRVPPTLLNGVVDVDVIPQMLVQRVDTVTGGVSAVYGSDAVTGVVNYIIDKKFNGLRVLAQTGVSAEGDARKVDVGFAVGTRLLDDRGHFEGSYEYRDEKGIPYRSDRDWMNLWGVAGAGPRPIPTSSIATSISRPIRSAA
jgi:4,5-dihydroxyphthalate decarboxylase